MNAPSQSYRLKKADGSIACVEKLSEKHTPIKPLIKAMRPHQWAKNALLFVVPALFLPKLTIHDGANLILAFVCFSLLASATYILNDLFDMPDDREHHSKHKRPLASGLLGVPLAVAFMAIIIPACIVLSFFISTIFGITTAIYGITTISYSFRLKRIPVLDVFILAGLFMIRVIAGANVVGYPPTGWLLTFIGTFFLSLALGKRYVEVMRSRDKGKVSGRGYVIQDEIPLLTAGTSVGFASVIVLLIYGLLSSTVVFNFQLTVLLSAAILATWMLRFWIIAGRGELNDDPVVYAIKDRTSFTYLALIGLLMGFDITRPLWATLF